ncbi:DoxX family membrane protein [Rubrobacter indicoceani]|uniref:DoxX family membrane protein n=1 Tax=Rubrobacter indicoceani TaxID=2051957 RepID=UPI000E5BC4FB|nr:DoxX family membrane protein [Rubrobacter indicoceani]
MSKVAVVIGVFVAAVVSGLTAASPALAHVKWFENAEPFPLRWDLFFQPLPLLLVGAVLLATTVTGVFYLGRGRGFVPGPESFGALENRWTFFYSLVPLILGVHIAVPLLVNGVQGTLFSVDNDLPGVGANFLGFAETFVALSLFYGALTRVAAVGLAGLWVSGVFLVGFEAMLDNVLYLGFAAFFFFAGRGPFSVDRLLLPRFEPPERLARYAIPAARAGVGASFVVVAFTEKFANIPLGLSFLESNPLNFVEALGLPISDEVFVLMAGSVELGVGLFLLLGIFPREIALIALVPVNLTLTVFAWPELVGHLPIYGLLAVLLLWGDGRDLPLFVRGVHQGPLPLGGTEASGSDTRRPAREKQRAGRRTTGS